MRQREFTDLVNHFCLPCSSRRALIIFDTQIDNQCHFSAEDSWTRSLQHRQAWRAHSIYQSVEIRHDLYITLLMDFLDFC